MKVRDLTGEELQKAYNQSLVKVKKAMTTKPKEVKKDVNFHWRKQVAQRFSRIIGKSVPVDLKS
jgi:hypothetical protein